MKLLLKKLTFKNFAVSILVFLIYFKIFFILTNYQQFIELYKYSNSFLNFFSNSLSYFFIFWSSLNFLTYTFSIIFFAFVFLFILTFTIAKAGMKNIFKKVHKYNIVGSVLSFFGFGCVACGQTLLYPILLFLFTNVSGALVEYVGNFAMFLGIIFLYFGIKQNLELIKIEDKKICII